VVEAKPDEFWPVFQLAEAYVRLERWEEAITSFQRASKRADATEGAGFWGHFKVGQALAKLQRWSESVESLQRSCEIDPDNFWSQFELAQALSELQQWEPTASAFERAITIDPTFFWAHYGLGDSYSKLLNWDDAIKAYSAAAEIQPDSFPAHFSLAEAYFKAERWAEAVEFHERANSIKPDEFWSYFHLGEALSKLERWEEAVAAYEHADELQPNFFPLQTGMANALVKLARGAEAVGRYELAIAERPDDHALYFYLGLALFNSDEIERAIESFQKSIELNGSFCPAHDHLSHAYVKLGKLEEAEASVRRSIDMSPTAPSWTTLGNVLMLRRRTIDATTALIQGIVCDRTYTPAYSLLGLALEQDGRKKEAKAIYQQARNHRAWRMTKSTVAGRPCRIRLQKRKSLVNRNQTTSPQPPGIRKPIRESIIPIQMETTHGYRTRVERKTLDKRVVGAHDGCTQKETVTVSNTFRPDYLQDIKGIDLEVTSACTASCTFCPRSEMTDTKTFISMDLVNRLADDLRQYGEQKVVVLCGIGESTLHPDLNQIVDTLHRAGARVNMTTHGGHMTAQRFQELVELGMAEFHFSINAATATTHQEIMRLKIFDKIVETLQEILKIKVASYPDVLIHVSFVVCETNEHEVDAFVDIWRDKGVDQIWLHPTNNRAGLVSPEAKSVQMGDITSRYASDDLVLVDVFSHYEEQEDLCKIARSMIFISAEGSMRLCALDYRRMTSYGNLADRSLHEMHSDKLMNCLLGRLDSFCGGCDFCPPVVRDRVAEDQAVPQDELVKLQADLP